MMFAYNSVKKMLPLLPVQLLLGNRAILEKEFHMMLQMKWKKEIIPGKFNVFAK